MAVILILVRILLVLIAVLVLILIVHISTSNRVFAVIRRNSISKSLRLILCFENYTCNQARYNSGSNATGGCF